MTANTNGKSAFIKKDRSLQERMELYDATPKEYRDVLKYIVGNLSLPNPTKAAKVFGSPKRLQSWIKQKEVIGTRDTYGRSHPDCAY